MKNTKKKGFTIVELVIVIAVIAILAAVMIPTFSNVVAKANQSAALQEARNKITDELAVEAADGVVPQNGTVVVEVGGKYYTFTYTNGVLSTTPTIAESGTEGATFTD